MRLSVANPAEWKTVPWIFAAATGGVPAFAEAKVAARAKRAAERETVFEKLPLQFQRQGSLAGAGQTGKPEDSSQMVIGDAALQRIDGDVCGMEVCRLNSELPALGGKALQVDNSATGDTIAVQ